MHTPVVSAAEANMMELQRLQLAELQKISQLLAAQREAVSSGISAILDRLDVIAAK